VRLVAIDRLEATVIGGGIAGLATAVALSQAGWRVTILERAPAFGEVGAGLGLTANGMTALSALGLDQAVRAVGCETVSAGFQDLDGRWLIRVPEVKPELRAITTVWGLHRQRLHGVLRAAAAAADGVDLVTDAQVLRVTAGNPGREAAAVTWRSAGTEQTAEAALVVAADGVRSAVRAQLFPDAQPVYSGSTSWRAVISDSVSDAPLVEAWGQGTEFGAMRVSDSEMYWYGYFRHPADAVFADELAAAQEHFATWAPWVRAFVSSTSSEQLMRHDVYHLRPGPPAYARGRVVFVGDAAHAALPTSGQGAASALEDAVCVGRMIADPVRTGADLGDALDAFDRARRPRCRQIARTGEMIARLGADVGGGWRQTARNSLLRLLPVRPFLRVGSSVVRWTPP